MRSANRASWRRLMFGSIILGGLLFWVADSPDACADILFFKDGFAIEGQVKRQMTLEFDEVARDVFQMPKGFFFLNDGPRRIYFNPSQVRFVHEKEANTEVKIVRPNPRGLQVNPKRMPPLLEVLRAPDWDPDWNRRFQFRCADGLIDVPQHIGLLTPYWTRADSPGKYWWSCAYLTRELGPQTVQALLNTHPDLEDKKSLKPEQRLSLRLRKADFYVQAGWLDLAEKELDRARDDLPEQKERIEAARNMLLKVRATERIEEIKRRRAGGQDKRVVELLQVFPEKGATKDQMAEVEVLRHEYKSASELIAETARQLKRTREASTGIPGAELREAAALIESELNFENVARLDAFLGQARQTERLQKAGKKAEVDADQLLSLAVSGWLLGSASAEKNVETGRRLWRGRALALEYLRSDDEEKRREMLKRHAAGSHANSASIDEMVQIIRTLPPAEPEKKITTEEVEYKTGQTSYLLQAPPEYRHSRPYPVLIVLHQAGERPRDMLVRWSDAAAENGYLLVAPKWNNGLSNRYTYSPAEHAIVVDTLRDLKRRYNVDDDRVFLFGLGEGGNMALDVGLGHPDLFAGVLPMAAVPLFHAELCWRNAQKLPMYFACGFKSPDGEKIHELFNNWIVHRHYPALWVEYKGRGVEWFGGEVSNAFDWMRNKRRAFPLRQLGTDGRGGTFGDEFCSLRSCDNHFYWLSSEDIRVSRTLETWNRGRVQPASFHARVNYDANDIVVKATGVRDLTIWLARNSKGEDTIDFEKPVTVHHPFSTLPWRQKVTPRLDVLLDDLYQRGDRQQLFLAKITLAVGKRPTVNAR
jgi:pimeloyl-ACP methyl ester carboxylesterase